jgi:protein-L-isoaspartate(D-aspartate) O-methyltransferase
MINFHQARINMVDSQLRPNGITDHRIFAAMQTVPRENYVPESWRNVAYMDEDIPLRVGYRMLMEPMSFGRMLQLADIQPNEHVLIVGTATGYSAAVLALMAKSVVALESDAELYAAAKAHLDGIANVQVATGPLGAGWRAFAPYDCILIEGRIARMPDTLCSQVKDNGRIVASYGDAEAAKLSKWTVAGGHVAVRSFHEAMVAPLPGFEAIRPEFVFV